MQTSSRVAYPFAVLGVCASVGLLLTLYDLFFHVRFGVLAYAHPVLFGQAWWVYPNFVGAALGMYLSAKWLFARRVSTVSMATLAFSLGWFVCAYAATGLFVDSPQALLAGLLAAWAIRTALDRDRLAVVVYAIILAVIGCAMEGAGFVAGTFAYRDQQVFHVPYWLAGLYMNGSFVVLQIVRRVEVRYGEVT